MTRHLPTKYVLSGRIASGTRWRGADDPGVLADRAELRTLHLIEHVADAIAEAPSLNAGQRARIVAVLQEAGD